ncbi:LytR/AlgR family response regulator transcription factor [Parabacteroides sp.]
MKVLIIEDEAAAYTNIKNLLSQIDTEIEILDHFDTVVDSVAWLRSHPMPDLIFMDIQLADGSSFNIFECVTLEVPIIFTTAYDQYAIKAFEVNSIDYLLKPITQENVRKALDKYKRLNPSAIQQNISQIDRMIRGTEYIKRILIPFKDRILPIKTEAIAYFYNTNGESSVATLDGQSYTIGKSLDSLMVKLDPSTFFRVNRQFILSKEVIDSFTIWFDSRLRINLSIPTNEPVFIAKNKAAEFKAWLSSY